MKLEFFTVPLHDGESAAEQINQFLGAHRIVSLDKAFVEDGVNSVWTFCVTYIEGDGRPPAMKKGKVDYRDVLSETEFALYAKLRAQRKEMAEREGVPPYALFTNQQLADMVQRRVTTLEGLREINGIGEARIEKYGESMLALLREEAPKLAQPPSGGVSNET